MKKLFKNKNKEILDRLDDLEIKIDDTKREIKNNNLKRVKDLEDMLIDIKSKKIAEYENLVKRQKDEISAKSEVIDAYAKAEDKFKDQIKVLISEIEALKESNANLAKKLNESEKKYQKLRAEGIAIPKKVRATGPTKDTKQVMSVKSSNPNGKVNSMLKEISENNLKEEKK